MSTFRARFRDVLDPVQSRSQDRPLRRGFVLLGLVGLAVYMAVAHNIPFVNGPPGRAIQADFRYVNQVNDRTPVRVHGVDVGLVERIEPGPDPRRESRLTLRIDKGLRVHDDARASIRWRTLLGGSMYVDLDPGSADHAPLGDHPIPVSRTTNQVELDDVLRIYNRGTEQAQRDTLKGLADTFDDPAAGGRAIRALPALRTVQRGMEPLLGTESGDLRRMVASTAATVDALGADTGSLQALVTGARQTLGATDAQRQSLGELLDRSPSTLDATRVTMVRLRTTLDHLDPLVRRLRPGARTLAPATAAARPALDQADALLREARPVLRQAAPTFTDLRAAATSGVPVLKGLRPTINRLNAEILPFLRERDADTRVVNYEAVGPALSVLDMAAAEFDKEGFRLHLSTPGGSNSVITAAQKSFARQCLTVAAPSQGTQCGRIAYVLSHGWLGGDR